MPGGRLSSFRLGDRSELLAEFCLGAIAFTSRVPRQEDIGHDFFCVLSEERDGFIWAGPSFTVQVKSDKNPLVYEKPHQRKWLSTLENPFFVVIGYRDELRIEIYSTLQRLNGLLFRAAKRVELHPGPPKKDSRDVWTAEDDTKQVIYLGKPVISATVEDFMDKSRANFLTQVLKRWILLDRENVVNKDAGMHWLVSPESYETNELLAVDGKMRVGIYWNARNLDVCQRNFGRAATALRLTFLNALGPSRKLDPAIAVKIQALNAVLNAFRDVLDPASKGALEEYIGLHLQDK